MAITIHQNPQKFTPATNPVVWTFDSDQTGQINFSFIVELYLAGNLHSTHQVFPQFNILAKFNASESIRSYLMSSLLVDGTLTTNYSEAVVDASIIVYEKFGDPAVPVDSASSVTSFVFNGALRHPEFIAWNYEDYNVSTDNLETPGVLFLTSWPRSRKFFCGLYENTFLGFITDDTSVDVRIRLYDATGTLVANDTIGLTLGKVIVVDASPQTIIANSIITLVDFQNSFYYEISSRATGGGIYNGASESFRIYLDTECHRYETHRLHWLNKFGVWDAFTFTLVSTESTAVTGGVYEREKGVWKETNYTFPLYQGEKVTYSKRAEDIMTLNSDWITEEVQHWLVRELYESPKVYLEAKGGFEPVNVVNANYDLKQRRKDGLIQELVQLQKTYTYNSQLN
jgi:hypothetical protein